MNGSARTYWCIDPEMASVEFKESPNHMLRRVNPRKKALVIKAIDRAMRNRVIPVIGITNFTGCTVSRDLYVSYSVKTRHRRHDPGRVAMLNIRKVIS